MRVPKLKKIVLSQGVGEAVTDKRLIESALEEMTLIAGQKAKKKSVVKDVSYKEGRSGKLGFVLVEHQVSQYGRPVLTEEHDIVYKQAPKIETTVESVNKGLKPVENESQWSEVISPDPVLLFKYSALTFNGHRIHYDRNFCKTEFGFPGIVVHGPLIATLLIELVRKKLPEANVVEYSFRAKGPIFDFQTFRVEGFRKNSTVTLWAANQDGYETMTAKALLES
jgi:3-methylfumaryl-CoA hydratase